MQTPIQLVRTKDASWMRGETETCPIAYDTALRVTMTWMTGHPSSICQSMHISVFDRWVHLLLP